MSTTEPACPAPITIPALIRSARRSHAAPATHLALAAAAALLLAGVGGLAHAQ